MFRHPEPSFTEVVLTLIVEGVGFFWVLLVLALLIAKVMTG